MALGPVKGSAMSLEQLSGQIQPATTRPDQAISIQIQGENSLSTPSCKHSGSKDYGDSVCEHRLQDGTLVRSESHHEQAWNEFKKQTLISVFDAEGRLADKQMIRHKTEYRKGLGRRIAKESMDIVRYPVEGKITREVLIFRYGRSGKRVVKMNDARYIQIGKTGFAALVQNTSLTYDKTGLPLSGHASLWKDGKVSKELFRWDRLQHGLEDLDLQLWEQWEEKAKRASVIEALFA